MPAYGSGSRRTCPCEFDDHEEEEWGLRSGGGEGMGGQHWQAVVQHASVVALNDQVNIKSSLDFLLNRVI